MPTRSPGLRVLRGIGGEQVFLARYRSRSEQVRRAGVRVALPQSTLDSAQVLLPGIFVVIVTWLGARLAVEGSINAGELVAFYGYAAFLVIPLRTAAETVDKVTRAYVGANRMLEILRIEPQVAEPSAPAVEPPPGLPLTDRRSGLVVEPGLLTCVVSAVPQEGVELVDRLGRFVHDDGVLLGGVSLESLPVEVVRRRIVVSETDPMLFSGPLQEELDPWDARDRGTGAGGDRGGERGGRARRAARRARRARRGARALALGRSAAAARPRPRAPRPTPRSCSSSTRRARSTRTPRRGSRGGCARRGAGARR